MICFEMRGTDEIRDKRGVGPNVPPFISRINDTRGLFLRSRHPLLDGLQQRGELGTWG
jgi:hypothetical protein